MPDPARDEGVSAPRRAPSHVPAFSSRGTVLAFDFGTKRIGVAVGEPETGQAHALATIDVADNARRFAAISGLIEQWHPARLVVGLPLTLEGTQHELSARCHRFANQLQGRFGLRVELVDERLSSVEADGRLRQAGQSWKKRKARLDAAAAQLILQDYLDAASRR